MSFETQKDNGGPAFPHGNPQQGGDPGMSLRDWFAGQALPGVIQTCNRDTMPANEARSEYFARKAYEIADAMLAEREADQ